MLWLVQNIIFSISLIVIIHYLYIYFETTLTAPKVKDLIHCPKQKYKSLFDTINKNLDNTRTSSSHRNNENNNTLIEYDVSTTPLQNKTIGHLGNNNDTSVNNMKNDLKVFLRGIGLKTKSEISESFRPSYEMS